jgi:hypothetical protein
MKTLKSILFVVLACLMLAPLKVHVGAQGFCQANRQRCNGNTSCTPSPAFPSCDVMCRQDCQRGFTGTDSGTGCGNPGAGNCPFDIPIVTKTCACNGSACTSDGNNCATDQDCCSLHCSNVQGQCNNDNTPILISLENDSSYDLTSAVDGVMFDIFADGRPVQTAWTSADSQVAFLTLDRNRNGTIDSSAELFGNHTLKRDGTMATNGFDALVDLDGGFAVSDGVIDAHDPVYSDLRLWFDRNHNGISEPNELVSLSQAGVTAVFTGYRERRRRDENDNRFFLEGWALIQRHRHVVPRPIFDVILARAPLT